MSLSKKLILVVVSCLSFIFSSSITFAEVFAPANCSDLSSTDLKTEMSNQVDQRIAGLSTAIGNISLYSTRGTDAGTWVKNTNVWTSRGTTSLDFSGQSVYNSIGGYTRSGTMISPRHIVFANHYPISNGAAIVFIDRNGDIVSRTLSNSTRITDGEGNATDIRVGILNEDIPSTVAYYPILTEEQLGIYSSSTGTPLVLLDQDDNAIISNFNSVNDYLCTTSVNSLCLNYVILTSYSRPSAQPTRDLFYDSIIEGDSGNPFFSVINNQPVLMSHQLLPGGGPYYSYYLSEINTAMTSLGTAYQLSTYDTSCFVAVDRKPTITTPEPFYMNEDATIGTEVGTIVATSTYNYSIEYSITSGNTNNTFQISTTTGKIIRLNSTLSYATTPLYTLTVQAYAYDGGLTGSNRIATTTVAINILPSTAPITPIVYFYSTTTSNWTTVENWWADYEHTIPMTRIPNSTDTVFLIGPTVPTVDLTAIWVNPLYINSTATGNLTFNGADNFAGVKIVNPIIVGPSTFNGYINFMGTSTGSTTFNAYSINYGNITGDVIFNDSYNSGYGGVSNGVTYTSGIITGNVTLNSTTPGLAYNSGTVNGNVVTNGINSGFGTVNGNITLNGLIGTTTLSVTSSWGTANGLVKNSSGQTVTDFIFTGDSVVNSGRVPGNAIFDDYASGLNGGSYCEGIVTGDAKFVNFTGTTTLTIPQNGDWDCTVLGDVKNDEGQTVTNWVFNNSWNFGRVVGDTLFKGTAFSLNVNRGTIIGNVTFADSKSQNQGTIVGNVVFNSSSKTDGQGGYNSSITGDVTFNGSSGNQGGSTLPIVGNVILNSTGYNAGTITGNVTLNGITTSNTGTINGNATYSSSTSNGLLTLSKGYGRVTGSVKGGDGVDINSWVFNTGGFNYTGTVGSSTFNGTSYNQGTTTATTTFNDSSYNRGTITANAIFNGNSSENFKVSGANTFRGTVTGTKTRYYSTTTTASTRDFITDGPWIIQADNTTVTMADKTKYNASTTFQTFNGGLFSGLFPTLVSLAGNISTLSAVFNASISNISVVTPTAIGFNYGLTTDYGSIAEATGTGTFSASISGLQCGSKTYHYNAFATNVSGTSTTTDSTFTTGVCSSRKIVVSNPEVSTTNSVVVEQPSTSQTITPTVVQPSAPQTVAPVTVPNNNSIIVPPSFTTYLKLGNRGTEVTKLQDFLVSKGYSLPSGTTGYFGSQTQLALSKYQLDNNITSTGTLGPITRDYINNNTTAPITTTTKYIFNNNLKLNSVSEDVRQLQIYLNNNNFIITETGPGSKGNESTFYGQKTVQAVKKFQEAHVSEILTPNGFTSGTGMFYEGTRKWVNGN